MNEPIEQLKLLLYEANEDLDDLNRQIEKYKQYANEKRTWENAFQKWSDKHAQDGGDSRGICGYGSMCDWCEDNAYGRPCVRALNSMLRDKGERLDYSIRDYDAIWYGKRKEE